MDAPWTQCIERRIGPRVLVALLLAVLCIYLLVYLRQPALPHGLVPPLRGWLDWWDQNHYYRSAWALAQGNLAPGHHWYPLGYPLLGAIFAGALPLHPFLIPNLLCFLGIVALIYRLYRSELSRVESVGLLALVLLQPLVLEHLTIPWTTIPTQLGTYVVIVRLVLLPPTRRDFLWSALIAAAVATVRPGDLLFLAPIFLGALLSRGLGDRRALLKDAATAIAIAASGLLFVLATNKLVFGRFWLTPYLEIVRDIGFGTSALGLDSYALLLEARSLFSIDTPVLLARYPWLLLSLPGLLYWARRHGSRGVGVVVSLALTFLFYLSYNDFDASTAFRFSTIHYLLWMLPIFALFAYLTLRRAWRRLSLAVFLPALLVPGLLAMIVEVDVQELAATPRLRFAGMSRGEELLRDGDAASRLSAVFPLAGKQGTAAHRVLQLGWNTPQPLRLIQLYGWPNDLHTHPVVRLDGRRLRPNAEFRPAFGERGLVIFLRRELEGRLLQLDVPAYRGPLAIAEVRLGRPHWRLGGLLRRWLATPINERVRAWRLGDVDDVVGPWSDCSKSDGKPDRGIGFELDADVGRRVRGLEVRSIGDRRGAWVLCGGAPTTWQAALFRYDGRERIEVNALSRGGRFRLQLADDDPLRQASPLVMLGRDGAGEQIFRVPIGPARHAPPSANPARAR